MNKRIYIGTTLALALVAGCTTGEPPERDGGMADAMVTLECPDGTTACGNECIDTDDSRAHCGACDNACGAGETCVEGECEAFCPSTQTDCGGQCVSTSTDERHCGGCDMACAAGEICNAGDCELSCPAGQTACGTLCVDTDANANHCGSCGDACTAGQVCNGGTCEGECSAGLTQCGSDCVDVQTDPMHCGDCDTACPADSGAAGVCAAGTCRVACEPSVRDCNGDLGASDGDGCETPVETDPENCGACRRTCEYDNSVSACVASDCVITMCDDGFGDCDGVVSNGCESEVGSDPFNCGACGTVCAAGEGCFSGTCAPIGGESCSDALVLVDGTNTVYWSATAADYITSLSCTTSDPVGPDVVMSYTATADERVTVTITPPSSTRWALLLSTEPCGTVTGATCDSQYGSAMTGAVWLPAGQTVYVYLIDTDSGSNPLDNPLTVELDAVAAPCIPGSAGFVGGTSSFVSTSISSVTDYYVVADESPTGYVYVGGSSDIYRVRKDGTGSTEDVGTAAGLGTDQLGYEMLINGNDIFTVDSATTTPDRILWRISTDGGATWNVQDFAFFPTQPSDDFRGITAYGGRIYLLTEEDTSGVNTEIWSVSATPATLPAIATLELSIAGEGDCSALARDASYWYLACDEGDRVVRVPVAGGASEVITTRFDLDATHNALRGDDFDADGNFDALYLQYGEENIGFVCSPTSPTPVADVLTSWGTATGNYGLGFDATTRTLWAFDDDSHEFVRIE